RANNKVVFALTSFLLFCISSVVMTTFHPFFFAELSLAGTLPISSEGALYVKAIPTMVMNVRNESRLSMSQNRATIKALVIMLTHMTHQVNGAYYSYNCPSHVPFIKTLPNVPQQYLCFESSGGPHETFQSFSISPILVEDSDFLMKEINLTLTPDDSMPPSIEDDDYDSERDILILEELLSNDSLSIPENESFHFNIPSSPRPPAKPPDDNDEIKPNLGILTVKMVGDISEHYVPMPGLLPT
nr:hypothetical protein [Tanacetum cinerariifolium]